MTVTVTPLSGPSSKSNAYAAGTLTFANLNGGVNFTAGTVVILVSRVTGSAYSATPKIGGVTINPCANAGAGAGGGGYSQMYYADVPSGTGDSFTVTDGSNYSNVRVVGWFLAGAAVGGPLSTNGMEISATGNPESFPSIVVPTGGAALAGGGSNSNGVTPVWSNVVNASTGDPLTSSATGEAVSAHNVTAGAQVITVSGFPYSFTGVVAAWDIYVAPPTRCSGGLMMMGVG